MILVCFWFLESNLAFALFCYPLTLLIFRRPSGWYSLATYNPVDLFYSPLLLTGASALELAVHFLLLSSFTSGFFIPYRHVCVFRYLFCYLCSHNLHHSCCSLLTACHFKLGKTLKQKGFDNMGFVLILHVSLFTCKISASDILHLFI